LGEKFLSILYYVMIFSIENVSAILRQSLSCNFWLSYYPALTEAQPMVPKSNAGKFLFHASLSLVKKETRV
jgi:hypothetical protein